MAIINTKDKQILIEILQDYQHFGKRKFKDDEIILDLIKKLKPDVKVRLMKTRTEIAYSLC